MNFDSEQLTLSPSRAPASLWRNLEQGAGAVIVRRNILDQGRRILSVAHLSRTSFVGVGRRDRYVRGTGATAGCIG
jgi:hypothetical protein